MHLGGLQLEKKKQKTAQSVMSSSRSLSGELLCLYSLVLACRFQLGSFWLPVLCERPRLARRLDDARPSSPSSAELPLPPPLPPQWCRSVPKWWMSCRKFSRLRAQGPSFCQSTRWKAMMQCRFPPTCGPGSKLVLRSDQVSHFGGLQMLMLPITLIYWEKCNHH